MASGRRDESHESHPYLAALPKEAPDVASWTSKMLASLAGTDVGAAAMASNEALAAEHARVQALLGRSARGDAGRAAVTCLAASRRDFSTPRRRRRQCINQHDCGGVSHRSIQPAATFSDADCAQVDGRTGRSSPIL